MRGRQQSWFRYPPLVSSVVCVVLVLAVLPSALNLPQTNPSTTLEYAPVPPQDDSDAPPTGNVSSLNLASSSGPPDETGPAAPAGGPASFGKNPQTKRCVGAPPRQTEDPMSPPCVAFFEGDNFGATYQGINSREIRVLFYASGNLCESTGGSLECSPTDTYVDLAEPAQAGEHFNVRALRTFQRHFNQRYQTYGRFVHFFIYFDRGTPSVSPAGRRQDAAANYQRIRPFAAFSYPRRFQDEYQIAMAQRGVMNFGGRNGRAESFFQRFPRLVWGYQPSIEQQVENFTDFVCTRIVPFPAAASGNAGENGRERTLGLLHTTDESRPGYVLFAKLARQKIEACGGRFAAVATFPVAGTWNAPANQPVAAPNMARLQQAGVTTVIRPQGYETEHSKAAGRLLYYPEWIVAGDGQIEGYGPGLFQDQDVWHGHAWVVGPVSYVGDRQTHPCSTAWRETDPDAREIDITYICFTRPYFEDVRQLFSGIQVAGPRLGPLRIDAGFRAIPPHDSSSPTVPACFYEAGDYTCVKDAAVSTWDRDATNASSLRGCYRLVGGGARHRAGAWPNRNGTAGGRPSDACNAFQGGVG